MQVKRKEIFQKNYNLLKEKLYPFHHVNNTVYEVSHKQKITCEVMKKWIQFYFKNIRG